jgi:hypothetical protein
MLIHFDQDGLRIVKWTQKEKRQPDEACRAHHNQILGNIRVRASVKKVDTNANHEQKRSNREECACQQKHVL